MSRGIDTSNRTAAAASAVAPVLFIELQFGSGTQYISTAESQITWGGHDWLGAGRVLSIQVLKESEGGKVNGFGLGLTGAFAEYLGQALTETDYKGRTAIFYLGFAALPGLALAATPDELQRGRMDTMPIKATVDEGTGMVSTIEIALTIEAENFDFDQADAWYWSNEDLQAEFSGDRFLEYVSQMSTKEIIWPNREWYQR